MDYKSKFIEQSKLAVDEAIKVLKAEINFNEIDSDTKGKTALQVKKKAFVTAKKMIAGVLEFNYHEQKWARKSIDSLIDAGNESIESLISSLGDTVDVQENGISNDGLNVMSALDSKTIAFNDVIEIIDSIDDLKRISEEEEIVIGDNDFDGGYAERYADHYAKKKNKSGYREDIDAVVIDPAGTVGDIIEIADIRIALPKKPQRSKIAHENRSKKDQYWRRQDKPKGLGEKTAKRYEQFIEDEFHRKVHGYWFFNNGDAEYITGAHWMHMNHIRTGAEGGFYYFTKAQQKLFLFMEAVWCDQRCAGMILEKIRRLGATDMFMSFSLTKTTMARDKIAGMTSKKDTDAKKNFLRQTWMFANLPFYFKPICLDERSKSALEFRVPSSRLSKNTKDKKKVDTSLNTFMNFASTSQDSYDGDALYVYIGDEFSKWKKQNGNTVTHFEMVSKSATKGANFTGKIFLFSTVENVTGRDAEDDDAEAGDRYKWLYYNSDPKKRDANGQTLTGLYKLFISVYEHYEGYIDRYGYAITEDPEKPVKIVTGETVTTGIKTLIKNRLDAYGGNLRARYEFLRKTPIEGDDGFRLAEGACMFNQANILDQVSFNDGLPNKPYRIGNFVWIDGVIDGKVEFQDNPNGRFKVTWIPEKELQNSQYKRNGVKNPGNSEIGAFGIDPYKNDKTSDGKGSKGAMHGCTRVNHKGAPNNHFFLEYLCRPDIVDTFIDDCIKAMVFYGIPSLIESNVKNLLEAMYKRGYRGYSLNRPDKVHEKLSYDEKKYGGIPGNGEDILQMQSAATESYIETHVGQKDDGEFGDMYFNDTLNDWLKFDIRNRTKRDASISSSLALVACSKHKKRTINVKHNQEVARAVMRQFDNSGSIGRTYKN
jgi:hypothetical protein